SPPGLGAEMTLRISRSTAASCSSERSQVHVDQCSSWVRDSVPSGPSLGFAVLKDLLRLLWPFVYSPSSPLFLPASTTIEVHSHRDSNGPARPILGPSLVFRAQPPRIRPNQLLPLVDRHWRASF